MQSSRLPQAALNQLIEGASILEADSYGPKVYLLQDGNILKLFRRKRFFFFGPSKALFNAIHQ